MSTAQEVQRVSWELAAALRQRMNPLISKKSITGHRAPSTSDASPRGSFTSQFATPWTLLQVARAYIVLKRANVLVGSKYLLGIGEIL